MTEAVIVAAARTPIGRARKGSLVDVDAFRLAEIAVGEAVSRSGIDAADIDDVVLGESLQGGGDIARNVAVRLGLTGVPGMADNRHCASGLSAVQIGAGSIRAGMDRVVIAGGTESLSYLAADVEGARAGRRAADVDVAQPSRDPRRADVRHVDHGGREHRARDGPHPARRRRVGGVQPRPGHRLHRLRCVRGGDRPRRVHRPRGQCPRVQRRRAPSPRHHRGDAR